MDKKANFHMIPEEDKIRQQKGETGNTYIVLSMLLDDSYISGVLTKSRHFARDT